MTTSRTSRDWLERGVSSSYERTFRPDYVSFAGTYQCNLKCPHCCVPIEWTDRLPIDVAIRFLKECHALGINRLGFTGGEPLIYPEFVIEVVRVAAKLRFRFDKIMTNGVWFQDETDLRAVLLSLKEAGFTGKLGLSVDKFHGIQTEKLAQFCLTARQVFQRDTIVSLSYASRSPELGLEPVHKLAAALDGVVDWSDWLKKYMLVSRELTMTLNWNHLAHVERAESLPGDDWDGTWFEEDYCEGPGQAFIVNPKGDVKPCCGFASDLDQLTIGNIYTQSAQEILQAGKDHPFVGPLFRNGLSYHKEQIETHFPGAFPKATSNHCTFCWHILTQGLVAGMPGGGGQVGTQVGQRENRFGELITLGIKPKTTPKNNTEPA